MEEDDAGAHATLRLIARTLGVPVEQFFGDAGSSEGLAGHQECLRLWSRIKSGEGRERALECLRRIIATEEP